MMFKFLILFLLCIAANAKPILDGDLIGPNYKKLVDNVDSKLKFVKEIGKEKVRPGEIEELLTTPFPTIQLITTLLVDTKLDDDIGDDSSSSEEDNAHPTANTINSTLLPILQDTSHRLSVEEQENQAVFDDKQEILARKTKPQIIRSANTLPTILPQSASALKPTQIEPLTTPMPSDLSKIDELTDFKQKSSLTDKVKPSDASIQTQKHQPEHQNEQRPAELSKQLQIDSQQQLHNAEIMDDRREIAAGQQEFDQKTHESPQNGGSVIYSQNRLIPGLGEKLDPTFMPPITTPLSSLLVPQKTLTTTESTTDKGDQESIWTKIIKGVRCSHGDCEGVLVSTTPPGPRELKPSKIIRRARRQNDNVACKCLTG